MDYKYIEQLLERYWECETSLQEEEILRSFFSQDNVPGSLLQYKALFTYEQTQKQTEVLGEDFDDRMAELVAEQQPVKARTVSLTQRLMPFFRAAAIVAIILTLGNALQVAFVQEAPSTINMAGVEVQKTDVNSVAYSDTVKIDTMQKAVQAAPLIK
ncbi:MAG: pyruvate ferredoxin oxidoreductase [Prevotella sp.]|jgi:hypothetical protein|nr:pyruvate ferredoxin oxidoreductase [Prevotella sp.]